ncbi:unnamed protein product [Acanthoscelides obtectus]|uniref:Uncharacterized protein n=1 Tax=Acanthoscelides obtectus TaxID=200917 RepID=A0A9P0PRR7_ACAOB|nr:unnamed protein product [Acanthoscelides obtectus]CAK1688656.1 Protein bric-a-brac 2 [Acanthoscelides obtectus]
MKRKIRICTDGHLQNLEKTFKSLLQNDLLTDCTLWCRNGSIRVHKLVLAAVSPHFRKIFLDSDQNSSVYMYGIAIDQLQYLIELIYKGTIEVPGRNFNAVYDFVESLEITGLMVDTSRKKEKEKYSKSRTHSRVNSAPVTNAEAKKSGAPDSSQLHNADTEGQSGTGIQNTTVADTSGDTTEHNATGEKTDDVSVDVESGPMKLSTESEDETDLTVSDGGTTPGPDKDVASQELTPWQKMERKFICLECPRRFKRASHLARHQLVHSGEKPHECDMCHKTFSRHDKLKTHIKKMHTPKDVCLPPEALYAVDHVQILTGDPANEEERCDSIGSTSSMSDEDSGDIYVAKRVGRVRKPMVPFTIEGNPPVKKKRGRPPKNPVGLLPEIKKEKKKRGRPRIHPKGPAHQQYQHHFPESAHQPKAENHMIEVVPSDSLRYLTAPPTAINEPGNDAMVMEPEIEIQEDAMTADDRNSFLQNIGLLQNSIGTIGECTITMAPPI